MSPMIDPLGGGRLDGIGHSGSRRCGRQLSGGSGERVHNGAQAAGPAPETPAGPPGAGGVGRGLRRHRQHHQPQRVAPPRPASRRASTIASRPTRGSGFALAGAGTVLSASARAKAVKHRAGPAYLAALGAANYWVSTTRTISVAGADTFNAVRRAERGGRHEGRYRVPFGPVTVTPYAAAQAQSFWLPSHKETAASGSTGRVGARPLHQPGGDADLPGRARCAGSRRSEQSSSGTD